MKDIVEIAVFRGCAIAILALLLTLSGGPSPAAGQSGLFAAGGTWTNPPDGPPSFGTVVAFRWRVEALTTEGFQFTLRGPAGWNNDTPRAWQVRRAGIGWLWDWAAFPSILAVEGAYTLVTAIAGNDLTTMFQIDPSSRLQRPIVRVSAAREWTEVSWTFVGGAHSYRVTLLDGRRRVIDTVPTRSTSHTFNLELSSGVHRVSVAAFPSDITFPLTTLPKQYNCSEGSATFTAP